MENVVTGNGLSPLQNTIGAICAIAFIVCAFIIGFWFIRSSRRDFLHKRLPLLLRMSYSRLSYKDIINYFELYKREFVENFDFIRGAIAAYLRDMAVYDENIGYYPDMSDELLDKLYPLKKRSKKNAK